MSLRDLALHYAGLGYRVFPLGVGKKTPITEHGSKDATTDAGIIEAWWRDSPESNIGWATDGCLVADIDGKDNPWLAKDPDLMLSLAIGPIIQTPRGGRHYLYRQPNGKAYRNTAGKLAHKVDTRADGGYIVMAGSVIDGVPYQELPGYEIECGPEGLPEPPSWLCRELDLLAGGQVIPNTVNSALSGNIIPPGVRNDTLIRLAGVLRRAGMGFSEIAAALTRTNQERCMPPVPDAEVIRIVTSICRYEPDQVTVAIAEDWASQDKTVSEIPTAEELMRDNPHLHPAVIDGLLREGEIMNVIAPSKMGKSWMVTGLALSVCTGRPWLGMPVVQGDVLIVDNELHAATSANRIPRVAEAMGIPLAEYGTKLRVANLRGQLKDLLSMATFFDRIQPGQFKVIILDAFYRFLPAKTDENDNGTITTLYNRLDHYAKKLRCCFILIHHSSKGMQGGKDVTDVGAGAGAQARATDTHLILRKHKIPGVVVMESAIRSWPHQEPRCLRFDFPVWAETTDMDPADLEGKPPVKEEAPEVSPKEFAGRYLLPDSPRQEATVVTLAGEDGLKDSHAKRLLATAVDMGHAHRWDLGDRRVGYAQDAPPVEKPHEAEADALPGPQKRDLVLELHRQDPGLSSLEISRKVGLSKRQVNRILGGHDDA